MNPKYNKAYGSAAGGGLGAVTGIITSALAIVIIRWLKDTLMIEVTLEQEQVINELLPIAITAGMAWLGSVWGTYQSKPNGEK